MRWSREDHLLVCLAVLDGRKTIDKKVVVVQKSENKREIETDKEKGKERGNEREREREREMERGEEMARTKEKDQVTEKDRVKECKREEWRVGEGTDHEKRGGKMGKKEREKK
eukprot:CAMPEP_0201526648 /NCGR_PEP_ID=MMETSP0161_2-20130828/32474_1 /ASSEMBLY_ACC=CAM_ASM_000251 /TAXON_ID=180227 /ORGANISM="Neoparamoeba aestuarina, Strain SoJaBio B1-5/56/2" /LENGTH=112 /DNA_ID=CAMNT_0047927117 /DNA_START=294 /DNA_END=629 /DNA_ORIENTATION=+